MPEQQPMFDNRAPDVKEQISELEREMEMRHQVYPKLIDKGSLTAEQAAYRMLCLQAAIEQLRGIQNAREGRLVTDA